MLGKLARWLRMMGHDVKYSNYFRDDELLSVAKNEKRILLTRDFALYQQAVSKNIEAFYVEGNTESERLSEIAHRFGIPLEIDLEVSRCPKCGHSLSPVNRDNVAGKVEKNTLLYYHEFWICLNCGSVYWQGAHWTNIRATIDEAKKKLKEKSILPKQSSAT
jgi:uncharacterized protein with PIN domain